MADSTVILRADAGPAIGTGHLMRCLALAQACRTKGFSTLFVLALETPLEERLIREGMEIIRIRAKRGSGADAEETRRITVNRSVSWICLDGYAFDASYQHIIRNAGRPLLVIDDYAHLPAYDCDVLLNQNIDALPAMYEGKTNAKLLFGSQYALIREEFLAHADFHRTIPNAASKILVTLGGTNIGNALPLVCRALSLITSLVFDMQIILGGANVERENLECLFAALPHRVTFLGHVTDMPQRMAWADLAIAASGSTSWELLFMGLPFVTGIVAENQAGIAAELDRRGLAKSIGWYKDVSPEYLAGEISALVNDAKLREQMSRLGRRTVDGKGAEWVVSVMESLV